MGGTTPTRSRKRLQKPLKVNERLSPPASEAVTETTTVVAAPVLGIRIDPPANTPKARDGNPLFAITAEPKMPVINVVAVVVGTASGADPTPQTEFDWTATVDFDSRNCPNGVADGVSCSFDGHPQKGESYKTPPTVSTGKAMGGKFSITFDKIRGGNLKITVTATVDGVLLNAETTGWRIQGTNPRRDDVAQAFPDDAIRKIAYNESAMMQFRAAPGEGNAMLPYFSGDTCLGIGICQLTNPAPTADQAWNWRENVKAGLALYNKQRLVAKGYPAQLRKSTQFLALVARLNAKLNQASPTADSLTVPPSRTSVTVTILEFTEEQIQDDTIRGYNGYAGRDGFGHGLHEFRICLDSNGDLVVVGDPTSGNVAAQWERVPTSARPKKPGDPDYVNHVKNRNV